MPPLKDSIQKLVESCFYFTTIFDEVQTKEAPQLVMQLLCSFFWLVLITIPTVAPLIIRLAGIKHDLIDISIQLAPMIHVFFICLAMLIAIYSFRLDKRIIKYVTLAFPGFVISVLSINGIQAVMSLTQAQAETRTISLLIALFISIFLLIMMLRKTKNILRSILVSFYLFFKHHRASMVYLP